LSSENGVGLGCDTGLGGVYLLMFNDAIAIFLECVAMIKLAHAASHKGLWSILNDVKRLLVTIAWQAAAAPRHCIRK
jgi:hypothetical protein